MVGCCDLGAECLFMYGFSVAYEALGYGICTTILYRQVHRSSASEESSIVKHFINISFSFSNRSLFRSPSQFYDDSATKGMQEKTLTPTMDLRR